MATLVLHNGNRMEVSAVEDRDGLAHVTLPQGGSFTVPRHWVKRVDASPVPQAAPLVAKSLDQPLDPNLGRPTSESPPYAETHLPTALPPNDLGLDYRADGPDLYRALETVAGEPDLERQWLRSAMWLNAQRPDGEGLKVMDPEGQLRVYRDWRQYEGADISRALSDNEIRQTILEEYLSMTGQGPAALK